MKTSDYDIVHFLEEHSFISRSDVDAAIKNTNAIHVARSNQQENFLSQCKSLSMKIPKKPLALKNKNQTSSSDYNLIKKHCRKNMQRIDELQKQKSFNSENYRELLDCLLVLAPILSRVRYQLIRKIIHTFYKKEKK